MASRLDLIPSLREWMRVHGEAPASVAMDAEAVVAGRKPVLEDSRGSSSSHRGGFEFSCTGCGKCCRSYASTVLLDPWDLRRMRAAKGGAVPAESLRRARGLFTVEALSEPVWMWHTPQGEGVHGFVLPRRGSDGVVPIRFLRVRSAATASPDLAGACIFAVPTETPGEALPAPTATSAALPSAGPRPVRLRCSLGPTHMPSVCAWYPLGDFFQRPAVIREDPDGAVEVTSNEVPLTSWGRGKDSSDSAIRTSTAEDHALGFLRFSRVRPAGVSDRVDGTALAFLSVDADGCEGVGRVDADADAGERSTLRSPAAYRARNGLDRRRVEWRWFQQLATAVACARVDERLRNAAEVVVSRRDVDSARVERADRRRRGRQSRSAVLRPATTSTTGAIEATETVMAAASLATVAVERYFSALDAIWFDGVVASSRSPAVTDSSSPSAPSSSSSSSSVSFATPGSSLAEDAGAADARWCRAVEDATWEAVAAFESWADAAEARRWTQADALAHLPPSLAP